MSAILYTLIPLAAVLAGAILSTVRRPGAGFVSAMQHLAAGAVFLPPPPPRPPPNASPVATLLGGMAGVAVMLLLKELEGRAKGPVAMLGAVGIDILVDGLVLGLAFVAGEKAGILLTVALTLEVLFLGLTVTAELGETIASKLRVIATVFGLSLLLPLGAAIAMPVAVLPTPVIVGFLSFGLMALLYLVTEELLAEAHERPDSPLISAMFFVGFLGLLVIEELLP